MDKRTVPDPRNIYIKANVERLKKIHGNISTRELARMTNGEVSPTMISRFLKDPEEFQLSTRILRGIAGAFNVEAWMLLVPNFPFDAINAKPLDKLTNEGYKLLAVFESLPDDKRKAILDFALFQINETTPNAAKQIREARATYKIKSIIYQSSNESIE